MDEPAGGRKNAGNGGARDAPGENAVTLYRKNAHLASWIFVDIRCFPARPDVAARHSPERQKSQKWRDDTKKLPSEDQKPISETSLALKKYTPVDRMKYGRTVEDVRISKC